MKKLRKARSLVPAVLCLCVLGLAGCSGDKEPETVTVPTLSVTDKGAVTAYVVGTFEKEYYDVGEMAAMAQSEVDRYNADHPAEEGKPQRITIGQVSGVADDDRPVESSVMTFDSVTVPYHYTDAETYADYNETVFFYGTVAQALEEGYDLDVTLYSVKDGAETLGGGLAGMEKHHILIAETPAMVHCPGKPAYLSQGLTVDPKGGVNALEAQGVYYILMK